MAAVRNANGDYVAPSIDAMTRAAEGLAARIPPNDDFRLSIVNAPGAEAYPIASWTYLLISPHIAECRKAEALLDLVRWSLIEGEADATQLGYAPIAMDIRQRALGALGAVTCGPARRPVLDPDGELGSPSP
jgi:phosphate transport system substrate-binding protein